MGRLVVLERDFQRAIIDLAHLQGWRVHHTRPAQTNKGWRTPMQGEPGFPDLVLAKNGRVIFAELKSDKGRTSANQRAWLEMLAPKFERVAPPGCEGVYEVHIWRPSDWDAIERVLTAPAG